MAFGTIFAITWWSLNTVGDGVEKVGREFRLNATWFLNIPVCIRTATSRITSSSCTHAISGLALQNSARIRRTISLAWVHHPARWSPRPRAPGGDSPDRLRDTLHRHPRSLPLPPAVGSLWEGISRNKVSRQTFLGYHQLVGISNGPPMTSSFAKMPFKGLQVPSPHYLQ